MNNKEILQELNELKNLVKQLLNGNSGSSISIGCKYTFHAWLDEWLAAYKAPNIKAATLNTLDVAIRCHIKPKLPDIALNLISGLELQKFLTKVAQSRTRKTIFDVLAGAFRTAHDLKLIADNPMTAVKIPTHIRERGSPLTPAELTQFLDNIKGHNLEPYFLVLLYSGCRRSEALSLNVADIDYEKRLLHVRGTKTEGSDRVIPLFEKLGGHLAKLTPNKDGYFFKVRPETVSHVFKKLCPAHKLHDLRHTFATTCLQAKIPLKVVQTWLGHSKIDTTADIYSHVTAEIDRAAADTLDTFNR